MPDKEPSGGMTPEEIRLSRERIKAGPDNQLPSDEEAERRAREAEKPQAVVLKSELGIKSEPDDDIIEGEFYEVPVDDLPPKVERDEEEVKDLIARFGLDGKRTPEGKPLADTLRRFVKEGRGRCGYCNTLGGGSDGKCVSCGAPSDGGPATPEEIARELTELDGFVGRDEKLWGGVFLEGSVERIDKFDVKYLDPLYRRLTGFLVISRETNDGFLREVRGFRDEPGWGDDRAKRDFLKRMWQKARDDYIDLLVGNEVTQRKLGVWKMKARRGQPIDVNSDELLDLAAEIAVDRGWEPGGDLNMLLADELGRMVGVVEKKEETLKKRDEHSGFVVPEVEVSDDDLGKFRKRLVERVGLVESINVDKELMWGGLLNEFARMKGRFSAKLPELIEQELRAEFLARMELNAVRLYWSAVKSARSPDDTPYDTMEKSMSGCPTLSVDTYSWLTEQSKYKTIENGGRIEEIDLTRQVDEAMGEIYRRMLAGKPADGEKDERLDMWLASEDEKNRVINEVSQSLKVNKGSVGLGWNLVEAECWAADVKKTHPAFRVCSFSSWRIQRYKSNLPVQGGIRLVQEWRDRNPRAGQDDVPDNIFEVEGKTWARTGLRVWPGAEQAARDGKYLERLAEYMKNKSERLSPQLLVMEDLGLGSGVFDTLNEMVGKTTTRDLSPGLLGKLRGKLYLDLMNVLGEGGKVADPNKVVGPVVGELLNQWARSYLWGASWANIDIGDTTGEQSLVLPTLDMLANFRDLIIAYDSDADEGINIGHKQGSDQSKKDAKEFAEWFENLFVKKISKYSHRKVRPGISKQRRDSDYYYSAKYDPGYWLKRGKYRLLSMGKSDVRWWLR